MCSLFDWRKVSISIHAPAWGATLQLDLFRRNEHISIHAPAWGATASGKMMTDTAWNFNPRTRMGCDLRAAEAEGKSLNISIHAPAWGATQGTGLARTRTSFQSTHPHGVRRIRSRPSGVPTTFQSTHPHGVRPDTRAMVKIKHEISIHAPAWGATPSAFNVLISSRISIHAPAWGATTVEIGGDTRPLFQSTHPHGVRRRVSEFHQ